jgi:hypothetical protein
VQIRPNLKVFYFSISAPLLSVSLSLSPSLSRWESLLMLLLLLGNLPSYTALSELILHCHSWSGNNFILQTCTRRRLQCLRSVTSLFSLDQGFLSLFRQRRRQRRRRLIDRSQAGSNFWEMPRGVGSLSYNYVYIVLEERVNHGIALSSERSRGRPEEEARS